MDDDDVKTLISILYEGQPEEDLKQILHAVLTVRSVPEVGPLIFRRWVLNMLRHLAMKLCGVHSIQEGEDLESLRVKYQKALLVFDGDENSILFEVV